MVIQELFKLHFLIFHVIVISVGRGENLIFAKIYKFNLKYQWFDNEFYDSD